MPPKKITTEILSHKIKPFNYLLSCISEEHPDLKIPKHALLIGAGCSLQCGIPLGSDIIDLCKMHAFLKEQGENRAELLKDCKTNKEKIKEKIEEKGLWKKYEAFVKDAEKQIVEWVESEKKLHLDRLEKYLKTDDDTIWEQYKDSIAADNSYGFWMNQYSEAEGDRQRFIEDIMDDKQPDGAYIILSYLIEKRKFTNILTTNFDDLVNEAVMYYTSQRCRFYLDDELSQYISVHNKKPNIIKLHGDYRFANMKNTQEETDRLTNNIELKLQELLSSLGLIMVGYNGADYSIMNVLQKFKDKNKYPLIWCGMDAKKVHWRVAHLINNTPNSFFVEIKGFDWFMGQLAIRFLSSIPDIVEKAKEKKKIVDAFLEKFKVDFKKSGSSEDVAKLDETIDKWTQISRALTNKDYPTIVELESKIIDSGRGDALDYGWRGAAYNELDEYQKAIEDLNKAIKLGPSFSDYCNMGYAYNELKDYEKAIWFLNKAIELNPNFDVAYNNRGSAYNGLREYQKAIEDYNKSLELNPNNSNAYGNRGYAYNELKKYQKAIEDFNSALKSDPNFANPYKHRGIVYIKLQRYKEAMQDLDKAIAIKRDYWQAYEARAELHELMGEPAKAKQDREKAKELKEKE